MARGHSKYVVSGQGTTDAYAYTPRINVKGGAQNLIGVDCLAIHSAYTLTYLVRGYPVLEEGEGGSTYAHTIKAASTINSGDQHFMILSDPYEQVDVGVKHTTSNQSGVFTVINMTKRY
jgi:hypothetical protein